MSDEVMDQSFRDSSIREAMLDSFADVVFAFSPEGELLDWNRSLNEVSGYSDEEIASMHPVDFFPEEEHPGVQATIREILATGQATFEGDTLTKDRRTIPFEIKGSLLEQNGRYVICGTARPIMVRRRQKEKLDESEQKYRRLFEESQEGIAIISRDGVFLDVNPQLCALNGYSRKELVGMETAKVYADPEECEEFHRQLLEHGSVRNRLIRIRRKDGRVLDCQVSASALTDAEGNVEAFQSYSRDITEQRWARQALEESERKFRELAEQSILGIVLVQDNLYRYVNPRMAVMFGYEPEELVDTMGPADLVHPGDWPRVQEQIATRLSGDEPTMRYQARGVRRDGEVIYVDVFGTQVTAEGKPAILCYLLDVTKRHQLQREILNIQEEERRRMGKDLHDGVGAQLSGIHMILGPLTRNARERCPDVAEYLEHIQALVAESSEDVRRISHGLSPVNLHNAGLESALGHLAEGGSSLDVPNCTCHIEGEPFDGPDEVTTHLYWIAQEAVTNARKYAAAESIQIRLTRDEARVILTVEDDGKGFAVSDAGPGGLGLRTMRYRAELIGGTLEIKSRPSEGTTVRCVLPGGVVEA